MSTARTAPDDPPGTTNGTTTGIATGTTNGTTADAPPRPRVAERARTRGTDGAMETAFGFQRVGGREEKQGRVNGVFASVARRYDAMNDLMSGGLHRAWKDAMVARLNPSPRAPRHYLDVAGGTGDIAFRIAARAPAARVTVADISAEMLRVGAERAIKRGVGDRVAFEEVNAESLPYAPGAFDGYTIAFGIRNVPRIDAALAEARRVLKPGSRILVLEFSEVDVPGLDKLYDAWSFNAIPAIGRMVTGDAASYRYLVESIRRFPAPDDFAGMIEAAGFERVRFDRLTGGVVALHEGWVL